MTLKELARLKFGPLSDADRDVYTDVRDEEALIAFTHDQTFKRDDLVGNVGRQSLFNQSSTCEDANRRAR